MKRGQTYKKWTQYYVIFSGGYLYFFLHKNDLTPTIYSYVKNSTVSKYNKENVE